MLTLLLVLTTSPAPTHLPLPSRPAAQMETNATPLPALQAWVEAAPPERRDLTYESNLNLWVENGHNWSRKELEAAQPPSQARHRFDGITKTFQQERYLPWHSVYQQRAGWPQQFNICDTLWFRIVTQPTALNAYFVVELEGLPHWKVRARNADELQQRIVERYAALFDSPLDYVPSWATRNQTSPSPAVIYDWNQLKNQRARSGSSFTDGLIDGVEFVF